jgi:hypothetical protein
MNQITVESNVVEIKTSEQVVADKQIEEAIAELNSAQLALIGGGTAILIV